MYYENSTISDYLFKTRFYVFPGAKLASHQLFFLAQMEQ